MAVDAGTAINEVNGSTGAEAKVPEGDSVRHDVDWHERDTDAEASSAEAEAGSSDTQPGAASRIGSGLALGLVLLVALTALVGWLGYRAYQANEAEQQRALFLHVGRQGALHLTSIDYTRVDADIQRVLDSSTGAFYDDFQKRSPAFADVVRQSQSKTQGTITEAGVESVSGDTARVLVAVSVKTSNVAGQDQPPRQWRMRIDVQQIGDEAKVANVGFAP